MSERLLTAREVGEWLGFAPGTIVDWFERGELPGFKLGGRLRFRLSEVEAWLEEGRRGPDVGQATALYGWTTQRTHSTIRAVNDPDEQGDEDA